MQLHDLPTVFATGSLDVDAVAHLDAVLDAMADQDDARSYKLREVGHPDLQDMLAPNVAKWRDATEA